MKKINISLFLLCILIQILVGYSYPQTTDGKIDFPELNGFTIADKPEVYHPGNLYDYINGAADAYLSYDFRELFTATYENDSGQSIVAEIYIHKDRDNAFGIYAQERYTGGKFLNMGAEGYYDKGILNFFKDTYYIKLFAYYLGNTEKDILTKLALGISDALGEQAQFPSCVSSFPQKSKILKSEKFINENFLGYSFLGKAFTADYLSENIQYRIFIIKCETYEKCNELIIELFSKNDRLQETVETGEYFIEDKYHGKIFLNAYSKYLVGIIGINNSELEPEYCHLIFQQIEEKLEY
ncbi:DUF6599 family protein [Bacteroidota bacterium]